MLSAATFLLKQSVPQHRAEQAEEEMDALQLPMSHWSDSVSVLKLCPCRRKGDFIHLLGGLQALASPAQMPAGCPGQPP